MASPIEKVNSLNVAPLRVVPKLGIGLGDLGFRAYSMLY